MAQTYDWNEHSGIILIFNAACPSDWTRVSAWDGLYLRCASSYGGTGGGTHTHSFNPDSKTTGSANVRDERYTDLSGSAYVVKRSHTHSFDRAASTSSADNPDPPYREVVFCKKD